MLLLLCGSTFAEDIIWQEDWTGYAKDDVPSAVNSNYSETNGGSTTKIYEETLAGGTSPELLVGRKGGSFAATIALNGKSGEMMLAFKSNKALTITTEGATLGDVDNKGNDYLYPLTVATGTEEITITFTQAQSSNARLDDIKLYQGTAKKPAGLSWGKASTTLTIGQEVTLVLSNENQLPVTYTSSDETVATIDAQGVITLVAAGKTTLTATFEGNDEYEAQSVSIELTVKDPDEPGPVTGTITVAKALEIINELENGKSTSEKYEVKGFVVGTPDFQRKNDGSLYGNVNLQLADEKDGQPTLTVFRGKDYNNTDFTEETISRITEGDEVVFEGKLTKYSSKDDVITPELTSCYLISVNGVESPVEEIVEAPVFTPNGGEFDESVEVTLTCATEGATIMYRLDDSEWTVYTAPFTLTESCTVVAYAEKDGKKSEQSSAIFNKKGSQEEPVGEEVTINFDDDYATLFPSLPGVSSGTGADAVTDGDFTEATTSTAVNGVTVTVSVAEEGKTANRIWSGSPRLRMYSGNFTVTGKNIVKIEFAASDFNLSTETGTLEGKIWTGKADEVVFKVKKKTLVKKIVVTLAKDGNEIPGDMNHDGKLDIADVISVLNLVANDHYDKIADLNNDDAVTIADAMLLLEQVAGTK